MQNKKLLKINTNYWTVTQYVTQVLFIIAKLKIIIENKKLNI